MDEQTIEGKNLEDWPSIWIGIPSVITVMKQTKAYTGLSFMAEVGGYVGLFLGSSFYGLFANLFDKVAKLWHTYTLLQI